MKYIITAIAAFLYASHAFAFCGFYVAKADTSLFNEASKVVLARKDNRTVITMVNDYGGEPNEFAMVIPVPEVLEKEAIQNGAEAAICQEVNDRIVLHYTGELSNIDKIKEQFSYIQRLRIKQVPHIEIDDNLRKVVRTQVL